MTTLGSSLKATDPIAGLKRAQEDYKAARTGYRTRQRQILQDVYRSVSDLIDDDEARGKFMNGKAFAKHVGDENDHPTDADRADIWFYALAYVYQAKSRESRKRASKHASALRLLYAEDVDVDEIAVTIKKRGGIQKLADEAAKPGRKGAKKRADEDDAEASAQNGKASDDAEGRSADEDDAEREAENGEENDDAEVGDAEEGAEADEEVRFSISDELTEKIRKCRGKRIKIIARVPPKMHERIEVLKVIKLNTSPR